MMNKYSTKNIDEQIEKIYERQYSNYFSPSRLDKYLLNGWEWIDTMFLKRSNGESVANVMKKKVKELLKNGYRVTSGWSASSVRDAHDYFILYKEKRNDKKKI